MDKICIIRDAVLEDRNFIMSSWLKSFKSSHYAGTIPDNLYWSVYQQTFDQLLARPGIKIRIAANPEDEKQIFGYCVFEKGFDRPVVHWLYVKHPFRGFGIARELMSSAGIDTKVQFYYTHRVIASRTLTAYDGPFPQGKYRPEIARRKKYEEDQVTKRTVPSPRKDPGKAVDPVYH